MKTKRLGRTGLEVPIVGIGTAFLGFNGKDEWVDAGSFVPDEKSAISAVAAFLEAGPAVIDTSPMYGGTGVETAIGKAIRASGRAPGEYVLMTKAGRLNEGSDYSSDAIRANVMASLERLGVDRLDIVSVHDAMGRFDEVMGPGGALAGLRELQAEGLVRFIGIACNKPEANAEFMETGEFDVAVVAGAWSLINQKMLERVAPAAERYDIGILSATPLERGLLVAGVPESREHPSNRVFDEATLAHVTKIQALCGLWDVPLVAVALQWLTRHPLVASAVPGARNLSEAESNIASANLSIPEGFWDELAPLIQHWEIGRK